MVRSIILTVLGFLVTTCLAGGTLNKSKAQIPPVIPLMVIGSGPAGHSAAQYGAHLGIPTKLISGPLPGGLLTQTSFIENYPGVRLTPGTDLMELMKTQTADRGVEIIEDSVISIDLSSWPFTVALQDGTMYNVLALVIATGATPKLLEVPGEKTFWGRGISSCALCDGFFYKGKDVVVVGGGDSAIEEAIQLSAHAKTVTILVRSDRMRAAPLMQSKLSGYSNIKPIEYAKRVARILGSKDEVTGLEVQDLLTNQKSIVSTDGLFLAIGHTPCTELVSNQLELTESGHIKVDERTQATSVEGVYAAGDVEDAVYRQAIVAAGRGCKAAIKAVQWLREMGFSKNYLDEFINSKQKKDLKSQAQFKKF